jgi:hypothetical protein
MVSTNHPPSRRSTRRQMLAGVASVGAIATLGCRPADAASSPSESGKIMSSNAPAPSGALDFDFVIGDWTVRHRQLRTRLAGDTEWLEFSGSSSTRKILAGLGNLEETEIGSPRGAYHGAALRLYDPAGRAWSIYWMDSRYPGLDTPVVGRFEEGVGRFYGDERFDGRIVRLRLLWTPVSAAECRWEQAYSADGGANWETNWIMEFARV